MKQATNRTTFLETSEMTITKHRVDFRDAMVSSDLLDNAIDWIATNLSPEDVFSEEMLAEWAEANDYRKACDDKQ